MTVRGGIRYGEGVSVPAKLGHVHSDWTCPAHTCAPAGTPEACSPAEEREVFVCNPYYDGRCPEPGFEPTWVEF